MKRDGNTSGLQIWELGQSRLETVKKCDLVDEEGSFVGEAVCDIDS